MGIEAEKKRMDAAKKAKKDSKLKANNDVIKKDKDKVVDDLDKANDSKEDNVDKQQSESNDAEPVIENSDSKKNDIDSNENKTELDKVNNDEDKNEINDSDKIEIEAPKEPESVPDVNEDQNKNSEIKQSESIKKEQQVQTEEPVISESDANDKDDKQQKSSLDLINDLKNSNGDKAELVSMMNAISKAQHEEKQMTENSAPKPNDASTKSQLKPIEYPTKEDQQLRYIYQTIKPPKDAEKYLTPKHFQEFLLNESAEMLNDEVMLLFRERVKQTIKFHNVPSGAWSGWYTKSKDYSKISAI